MKNLVLFCVLLSIGICQAACVDWMITLGKEGYAVHNYYVFKGSQENDVLAVLNQANTYENFSELDTALKAVYGAETQFAGTLNTKQGASGIKTTEFLDSDITIFELVFKDLPDAANNKLSADYIYTPVLDASSAAYTLPETPPSRLATTLADFTRSGTVTFAPEPSSALLLFLGMAALGLKRKVA